MFEGDKYNLLNAYLEYTYLKYIPSALYSCCNADINGRGTLKGGVDKACEVPILVLINTSVSFLQEENGTPHFYILKFPS